MQQNIHQNIPPLLHDFLNKRVDLAPFFLRTRGRLSLNFLSAISFLLFWTVLRCCLLVGRKFPVSSFGSQVRPFCWQGFIFGKINLFRPCVLNNGRYVNECGHHAENVLRYQRQTQRRREQDAFSDRRLRRHRKRKSKRTCNQCTITTIESVIIKVARVTSVNRCFRNCFPCFLILIHPFF